MGILCTILKWFGQSCLNQLADNRDLLCVISEMFAVGCHCTLWLLWCFTLKQRNRYFKDQATPNIIPSVLWHFLPPPVVIMIWYFIDPCGEIFRPLSVDVKGQSTEATVSLKLPEIWWHAHRLFSRADAWKKKSITTHNITTRTDGIMRPGCEPTY